MPIKNNTVNKKRKMGEYSLIFFSLIPLLTIGFKTVLGNYAKVGNHG
jgi:hypothetical protein